jgi:hypothetical protein
VNQEIDRAAMERMLDLTDGFELSDRKTKNPYESFQRQVHEPLLGGSPGHFTFCSFSARRKKWLYSTKKAMQSSILTMPIAAKIIPTLLVGLTRTLPPRITIAKLSVSRANILYLFALWVSSLFLSASELCAFIVYFQPSHIRIIDSCTGSF